MGSGQILAGRDDTEAVLGGGTLRLAAPRSRTDIPLVVVREVRADGREVVVELTDGAVHRLDGTNPTAAGVFAAALTAALPQERDPAGSGRVIVTRDEPREPNPRGLRFWVFTVVSGILVAGYLGFLVFSAVNHGPEVIFGILAAVPLLLGYAALVASVALGPKYAALARRGITVMAWLSHRSRKGQSAYEYADPEGGVHQYRTSYRGEQLKLVYDPQSPTDCSRIRSRWAAVLTVLGLLLLGVAITGLGIAVASLAVVAV
ncbi:hypothetical protein OG440_02315 [Streptomyces sp. NBC_00637]|uniref:hypothetical protein n=1 Tax=Streptomyces sp. NBC_00637 TaxID=2903667 RepID=UPI003253180B